jgi:hypothetical protein
MNQDHTLQPYFIMTHFNITLLSTPRSQIGNLPQLLAVRFRTNTEATNLTPSKWSEQPGTNATEENFQGQINVSTRDKNVLPFKWNLDAACLLDKIPFQYH